MPAMLAVAPDRARFLDSFDSLGMTEEAESGHVPVPVRLGARKRTATTGRMNDPPFSAMSLRIARNMSRRTLGARMAWSDMVLSRYVPVGGVLALPRVA
jgi:hypothetical protein